MQERMNKTKLFLFTLLFTIFFVAVFASNDEFNPPNSQVVNLSEKTFKDEVASKKFALVEFYAPWCPHCKHLVPEYEKLAAYVKQDPELEDKVLIAKIDCESNQAIASQYGIQGFPTLKLFKNGEFFKDYEGQRSFDAMKNFIVKKVGPPATPLQSLDAIDEFVRKHRAKSPTQTIVIGQFTTSDSPNREAFLKASDSSLLDGFLFAEVVGDPKIEKEQVEVYPYFEDASVETDNFSEIERFILKKGFPLVDELNGDTFPRYAQNNLPIVIGFVKFSNATQKQELLDLMKEVAKKPEFDNELSFAISDADLFFEQYKVMGGDEESLPGVAVMDWIKRTNYPYKGELKVEPLTKFLKDLLAGEVTPHIRSQPVPATQKGPVYELVGKTFDEIVLDENKDVFVEFYAPWCGHCKNLAPKYEELAKKLENARDKLVIAKIDATENDTPNSGVQIQGFPTLYLYPAGQKNNPILYEGSRTVADMTDFIKKHAVASKDLLSDLHDSSVSSDTTMRIDITMLLPLQIVSPF
jgi:protein disulfide-isomerase A1